MILNSKKAFLDEALEWGVSLNKQGRFFNKLSTFIPLSAILTTVFELPRHSIELKKQLLDQKTINRPRINNISDTRLSFKVKFRRFHSSQCQYSGALLTMLWL